MFDSNNSVNSVNSINPIISTIQTNKTIQMKIGTIQKFSLIDYPGKISAVIGTQGVRNRAQGMEHRALAEGIEWGIRNRKAWLVVD
jgi:hypothetical protein